MSSTDIEDIVPNHNKNYFRTVNPDVDKQLVNFMIELCNSQYESNTQYGEKFTELRKKYHISPSKPDLTIMYQSLLKNHQIEENKSLTILTFSCLSLLSRTMPRHIALHSPGGYLAASRALPSTRLW